MSRSVGKAEQEVEERRERLNHSLDALQTGLDVFRFKARLTNSDACSIPLDERARDLFSTSRKNPVPALMICVGVGWLLYETVKHAARVRRPRLPQHDRMAPSESGCAVAAETAHREAGLDEALEETFPGSDPVSVRITK